ncbi:MAG: dihydrofolate reductase [Zoogloeaceae bacterium]|jgi:dihydrofolate reductase|nr:dihydrofolate reductase [Zoogloeaceae bacterium]
MSLRLSLIAALARERVIGADNRLPWHLPEDLRRFRELTWGHCVLMGRKTWESLPEKFRPLPGRRNLVLSHQPDYVASGAERVSSIPAALEKLAGESAATEDLFVIGGEQVYRAALPFAERLLLTEIDLPVAGDAWFPAFSASEWREIRREERVSEAGISFSFVTYARNAASA